MARTALDLYVAAVASKKNGEFINTERLKEAYIGVVDAMAKEIERDGSSLLLNLFAARWYVGYPKSDVYIANLTKIELDANFSKYLNSWRSSDYKKQYSAKFKRIDTSGVVAILEGVQAFFDNSSDKDTILGRYSEHFKSYLFNKNISTKSLITLLPKKLENSTKHYTASAFAELIRAIDAALVKKQGSAKAIREAENKRQAELEARLQETEARRQAELRATQEAEARKQAELKAAEEERKRILLQAKLKEAEAKAKQDEKARKAEFEARRVQE
ncbi:MAG: hypothetical protein FWG65_05540, partial [Turicibacter sp.]|nr:hypothetical protein [Turicibacter sp.]